MLRENQKKRERNRNDGNSYSSSVEVHSTKSQITRAIGLGDKSADCSIETPQGTENDEVNVNDAYAYSCCHILVPQMSCVSRVDDVYQLETDHGECLRDCVYHDFLKNCKS